MTDLSSSSHSATVLTPEQREIALALRQGGMTHVMDRPPDPSNLFWQVGVGVLGVLSLLMGTVLVFFFTALGSIMVVMGAVTCFLAWQLGASPTGEPVAPRPN